MGSVDKFYLTALKSIIVNKKGGITVQLDTIIYEVKDHIAKITMNRPEKMNALNHALLRDIDVAFGEADRDPEVRVVILTGSGKAFSSGYDLVGGSDYTSVPEGYDEWTLGNSLRALRGVSERYLRIMNFPKPVIAQIHGYCLAGGCYLQMCCDLSIASEDSILGHPASRGGGVTSMPLWISILGLRKAKELLYLARLIDGKEAEKIGLVNRAVPREKLEEEVWNWAKTLAEVPADGMMMAKEAMNTHADILGRGAVFAYHRQLNALLRLNHKSEKDARKRYETLRGKTRESLR